MRFVVAATDDRAAAALVRMGYLSAGGGRFATRWFPRAAEPERHFARFTASIGPMVRQKAGLDPVPWEDALLAFVRRVEGAGIDWWLYGPRVDQPAVGGTGPGPPSRRGGTAR